MMCNILHSMFSMKLRLHELVKQSQADLVALEAYACRVAPWTVEECDASQWFPSMEDESIKDCKYLACIYDVRKCECFILLISP